MLNLDRLKEKPSNSSKQPERIDKFIRLLEKEVKELIEEKLDLSKLLKLDAE